ncbi:DUF998 domain-containing protein [Pseudoxanthomonas sp. PXM02]|uniref:DUF998 domain-containing protein n=1 Tax=Pseudoxanthomonas sp. PXM02 TaxID=2769294 RepID=UPI001781CD77|nr:DUF998 domain-containing protein [Pseudoxanthomonas sp. PXM02]MBD9477634.1 DUF998 domain-containing protein [Pseudoxanthomonas sp. PXM02]
MSRPKYTDASAPPSASTRLAAISAIGGAVLFLLVAGALQVVRGDLDWRQATLSQYLLGPWGLLLRTAYCLLAATIVLLSVGLRAQLSAKARSAAPVLLFCIGAVALAGVAIGDSWLPQIAPDFHHWFHHTCAITAFLCVTTGMVLQAWRFRLDAAWCRHFPLAAAWSVVCYLLLWIHALWPPAGQGWVQKLLILLIVTAMLLAGTWLWRAAGDAMASPQR